MKYAIDNLIKKLNNFINETENQNFILNDWIHLVKKHPVVIARYDSNNLIFRNIVFSLIKNICKILIELFKPSNNKYFKDKYYDFLIISHKLKDVQEIDNEDFYYGRIKEYFELNNFKYKFLYLNHSKYAKNDNSFFLNECSFFNKLKIFYKIIKISICFILKNYKKFDHKILLKVFVEFFSIFTFHNFIIFDNLKKISLYNKSKYIITTFEGYSWERAVFLSQKNQQTITIGYQHSYLSKGNNSIFEVNNKDLIPNVVLTSGEITRDFFKDKNFFDKVEIFGNSKTFKISKKNKDQLKTHILVAPDGVESECTKMMKFILNFSLKNSNYNFVFRLHPVIDFEKLKKKEKIFRQNFRNIIFSREKLEVDLERSSHCLYRGSTIAFNCVLSNVVPIFVNLDDKLSINVFDGVKSIKTINSIKDLEKSLKNQEIDHDALIFTKKYFHKINFEILKSL